MHEIKERLMKEYRDLPVIVGISRCLLGEPVRYNGGHKLDRFLLDKTKGLVQWVPVCPEVEFGLCVPREAMHLAGNPESPELVTVNSGKVVTGQMQTWISRRISELEKEDLCGFVFKSGSPSCGMRGIKIHDKNNPEKVRGQGAGLFALAFTRHFSRLPAEEEENLHDADMLEKFIKQILAFAGTYNRPHRHV
ncbi:MAG: DUF523 domain-containing protein [Desulfobacteraceae bacterium]|nr:DUF523 domain-containing protein [Desulfobacteraceae bacterium]